MSGEHVTHLPIYFHVILHNAAAPFDMENGWHDTTPLFYGLLICHRRYNPKHLYDMDECCDYIGKWAGEVRWEVIPVEDSKNRAVSQHSS